MSKSSLLILELSFRLLSDDSILCDNSRLRVSIIKKYSIMHFFKKKTSFQLFKYSWKLFLRCIFVYSVLDKVIHNSYFYEERSLLLCPDTRKIVGKMDYNKRTMQKLETTWIFKKKTLNFHAIRNAWLSSKVLRKWLLKNDTSIFQCPIIQTIFWYWYHFTPKRIFLNYLELLGI